MGVIFQNVGGGYTLSYRVESLILEAADTVRDQTSATYTKVKEIKVVKVGSVSPTTLRIVFDLWSPLGTAAAYGRVYRNGVPVGVERTNSSVDPVTYSEDIAGWAPGDLVQLYTRHSTGTDPARARNFRVLGVFDNVTYNQEAMITLLD